MSGKWLVLIELAFFFLVVFGWGFRELRGLKRDAREAAEKARAAERDG